MTAPADPTPDAYDPTEPLRGIYRDAEVRLLGALALAIAAGLADDATDASRALDERRLRRDTRRVVDGLNAVVPLVVDKILEEAAAEGQQRGEADQ